MEKVLVDLHSECCQEIDDKCKELGLSEGYRFFLCPQKVFSKETEILFLDFCPSIDSKYPNKVYSDRSCEHGCAYFSERWNGLAEGNHPLQV